MKLQIKQKPRLIVVLILLGILSGCNFANVHRSDADRIARRCFGLKLPKRATPIVCEDICTFTGEGHTYLVFEFDSIQAEEFINKNRFERYLDLPIKDCIPPVISMIGNYLDSDVFYQCFGYPKKEHIEAKGKYDYDVDNDRVFSIVIYDEYSRQLIAYKSFYEIVSVKDFDK